MNEISLVRLAAVLSERLNVGTSTLANRSVGDPSFFRRLEAGKSCTLKTGNKALQFLSDHWPDDLAWPADVPRPGAAPAPALCADPAWPAALIGVIPPNGETDAALASRAREAGIAADAASVRWAVDVLAHLGLVRVDRQEADWYVVRPREAA